MKLELADRPHRRYNPLRDEWVLVSPHRMERPWHGQVERGPREQLPVYDPDCYLCPGNERAGGVRNPDYQDTYVFENDFAALLPDTPYICGDGQRLLHCQSVRGACRVLCFTPRHDLTLAQMPLDSVRRVVDLWADQTADLGREYAWVQVFENKGAMMGTSNPHPHGQVWASDVLPNEPAQEDRRQCSYYEEYHRPLLLDYAHVEAEKQDRVVESSELWLAVVPYWAVWPFEILLLPRQHVLRLPDLDDTGRDALASILKRVLTRYDNLFEMAFPYSMGWHGAPTDGVTHDHWQLHAHFYPPLLRSATVRKFMVGYEMLGGPQRDLTAEWAARQLQALPDVHYKELGASGRHMEVIA
jgi:UDPglucose--hexose-1-phosphate uridylyltransferase